MSIIFSRRLNFSPLRVVLIKFVFYKDVDIVRVIFYLMYTIYVLELISARKYVLAQ